MYQAGGKLLLFIMGLFISFSSFSAWITPQLTIKTTMEPGMKSYTLDITPLGEMDDTRLQRPDADKYAACKVYDGTPQSYTCYMGIVYTVTTSGGTLQPKLMTSPLVTINKMADNKLVTIVSRWNAAFPTGKHIQLKNLPYDTAGIPTGQKPYVCIAFGFEKSVMTCISEKFEIPPPDEGNASCDIITPNIKINYGGISANDANGLSKTNYLYISCSKTTSVKVSMVGYNNTQGIKLTSDNSLISKVSIRDFSGDVGSVEHVNANVSTAVPVTSTLVARGNINAGPFSGSAIITVDIQ